jgi:predicted nucleic-acid-binding protein
MENKLRGSLDTNALLRLALGDILGQARVVKKLLEQSSQMEVADVAVFEMIFVMEKEYKLSRERIVGNVLSIVRHKNINCNRRLFELTLPLYLEHSKLSIIDCALTQYATLNATTPLYTFDKELAKKCPDTTILLTL